MDKTPSPSMMAAIALAKQGGGRLIRMPGGYWVAENHPKPFSPWNPHHGTTTAEALVKRGLAEYDEWKENSRGKFPVGLTVKDAPAMAAEVIIFPGIPKARP